MVSNNQGDTDGLDYVFDENDKLVLGGDFVVKNLNKETVPEVRIWNLLSFTLL
ncbi:MAG: hypothetical protein IJL89_05690 [Firmicutes bacterium]|nr:hypothetical protein [Bacillota bacterium]